MTAHWSLEISHRGAVLCFALKIEARPDHWRNGLAGPSRPHHGATACREPCTRHPSRLRRFATPLSTDQSVCLLRWTWADAIIPALCEAWRTSVIRN